MAVKSAGVPSSNRAAYTDAVSYFAMTCPTGYGPICVTVMVRLCSVQTVVLCSGANIQNIAISDDIFFSFKVHLSQFLDLYHVPAHSHQVFVGSYLGSDETAT